MTPSNQMIRVLVVDDSALMRKLIPQLLERDNAHSRRRHRDGRRLRPQENRGAPARRHHPRSGNAAHGRHRDPAPDHARSTRSRSWSSALTPAKAPATTFKALHMGAFDFVAKPRKRARRGHAGDRRRVDRQDQGRRRQSLPPPRRCPAAGIAAQPKPKRAAPVPGPASKVVAIGISTGGPNSLEYMLSQLPADFPAAILVVQHMPAGFTETFARRLNDSCAMEVKEAQSGDLLAAGRVLICPVPQNIAGVSGVRVRARDVLRIRVHVRAEKPRPVL